MHVFPTSGYARGFNTLGALLLLAGIAGVSGLTVPARVTRLRLDVTQQYTVKCADQPLPGCSQGKCAGSEYVAPYLDTTTCPLPRGCKCLAPAVCSSPFRHQNFFDHETLDNLPKAQTVLTCAIIAFFEQVLPPSQYPPSGVIQGNYSSSIPPTSQWPHILCSTNAPAVCYTGYCTVGSVTSYLDPEPGDGCDVLCECMNRPNPRVNSDSGERNVWSY